MQRYSWCQWRAHEIPRRYRRGLCWARYVSSCPGHDARKQQMDCQQLVRLPLRFITDALEAIRKNPVEFHRLGDHCFGDVKFGYANTFEKPKTHLVKVLRSLRPVRLGFRRCN